MLITLIMAYVHISAYFLLNNKYLLKHCFSCNIFGELILNWYSLHCFYYLRFIISEADCVKSQLMLSIYVVT